MEGSNESHYTIHYTLYTIHTLEGSNESHYTIHYTLYTP
jgi:hypothetical protein